MVADYGCAVDDNGAFPGSRQSDLGSLISSFLPGRAPDVYPEGTARLIPAGSKLNFQIHYSRATGKTEFDETSVGLIFAKEPPKKIAEDQRSFMLANDRWCDSAPPGNEVSCMDLLAE